MVDCLIYSGDQLDSRRQVAIAIANVHAITLHVSFGLLRLRYKVSTVVGDRRQGKDSA
ncbi:regulator of chromosome condensation (RCC1)-like protein [Corchorus olitorius]|uniref:Regulator of chromosome condensation (RCC1)-like protein n=1 Tax=Corchorus olitorius TaxID=93759 RepID=A0A1R3JC15_9ROSI|nr:regulator of chromosome condensation (RCC1)-like protein [Corchorus olitorius]